MTEKEVKIAKWALGICSVLFGLLCVDIDSQATKVKECEDTISYMEHYYKIGNDLENYVLDVVFETDIFDDITEEEQEMLDQLYNDDNVGLYYIKLIELCEKYYGNKE